MARGKSKTLSDPCLKSEVCFSFRYRLQATVKDTSVASNEVCFESSEGVIS